MSFLSMMMDPGTRINRLHNLFVSESKHLYLDAKGMVRHQQKPLDRRTAGSRGILTRLLILDVDSGAIYGELHDDATAGQLVDFLLRAWHPKAGHYFRGVPDKINVPAKVLRNAQRRKELDRMAVTAGVSWVGPLPSGFASGIHALRNYEEQIKSVIWDESLSLGTLQAMSAVNSYVSALSAYREFEAWDQTRPLPHAAKRLVEEDYGAGYWCSGPFEIVFPPSLLQSSNLGAFSSASLLGLWGTNNA